MHEFFDCLRCEDFLSVSTKKMGDYFFSKYFCRELRDMEKCFMEPVNKRCPGDESIEKLKMGFLEALKEPCAEYDVTENPVDNVFTLLAPYAPPNMNPDLM